MGIYQTVFASTLIAMAALEWIVNLRSNIILMVFEVLILLGGAISLRRPPKQIVPLLLVVGGYLGISLLYAVGYRGAHILDFILIFKAFAYVAILALMIGRRLLDKAWFLRFYWGILALLLFRYAYLAILFGESRPTLWIENNFELMFLAMLFLAKNETVERARWFEVVMVVSVFLLAASLSGALMIAIVLASLYMKAIARRATGIGAAGMVVAAGVLATVVSRRLGSRSIESTDRYSFMLVFQNEVRDWHFIQLLFGAPRVSPLSPAACDRLDFWKGLFSYAGDGSCYSVILHSFVLRALYDHGIMGLAFLMAATFWLLHRSGYAPKFGLTVVALLLANGLSVSSMNNAFFALGMIVILSIAPGLEASQARGATPSVRLSLRSYRGWMAERRKRRASTHEPHLRRRN